MIETEAKIEAYLTRRVGEILSEPGPQARSFGKSSFMMSTQVLADAGLITHDRKFEWNERVVWL